MNEELESLCGGQELTVIFAFRHREGMGFAAESVK